MGAVVNPETKYFDDETLILIEEFTALSKLSEDGKRKQAMVVDIMEFLNKKGFLTARQKGAVLGIVSAYTGHDLLHKEKDASAWRDDSPSWSDR